MLQPNQNVVGEAVTVRQDGGHEPANAVAHERAVPGDLARMIREAVQDAELRHR